MTKQPKPYAAQARAYVIAKFRELGIWLVFVVLAGAYPMWVLYNAKRGIGLQHVTLADLVLEGEMLLLAFGIAADSISRLLSRLMGRLPTGPKFGTYQLIVFLASIVFLMASGSEYSALIAIHLSGALTGSNSANAAAYLLLQSEWLTIAALGTGAGVVLVD